VANAESISPEQEHEQKYPLDQHWSYLLSAIGRVVLIIFADFQFLLASGKTTR
jgi:hypothetical protein